MRRLAAPQLPHKGALSQFVMSSLVMGPPRNVDGNLAGGLLAPPFRRSSM